MSLPEYPHFTLQEAAPGVYAALAGDTGASQQVKAEHFPPEFDLPKSS